MTSKGVSSFSLFTFVSLIQTIDNGSLISQMIILEHLIYKTPPLELHWVTQHSLTHSP